MSGLIYKNFRINFFSSLLILIITLISSAIAIICSILSGTELIAENDGAMMFFLLYYFVFMMPSLTANLLFEADENKTASAFAMALPQGGKGHVESKYWYILIQYLLVLFITFLTDTVTYVRVSHKSLNLHQQSHRRLLPSPTPTERLLQRRNFLHRCMISLHLSRPRVKPLKRKKMRGQRSGVCVTATI